MFTTPPLYRIGLKKSWELACRVQHVPNRSMNPEIEGARQSTYTGYHELWTNDFSIASFLHNGFQLFQFVRLLFSFPLSSCGRVLVLIL